MSKEKIKIANTIYCVLLSFLLLLTVFSNTISTQAYEDPIIVSQPYVWHRSEYDSFYTKSLISIWARIDVDSSNYPEQCRWVLIDDFTLDYDQDKLIILWVGATTGAESYTGIDDGDKITWSNIWLREVPRVGPGNDPVFSNEYPTSFLVEITAIIDENVPGGSILRTTVRASTSEYDHVPEWYKTATAESRIVSGDLNLGGFNVENKIRYFPANLTPPPDPLHTPPNPPPPPPPHKPRDEIIDPIDDLIVSQISTLSDNSSSNASSWNEYLNFGWVDILSAKPGDVLQMQINLSNIGVPGNSNYLITFKDIIVFLPKGLEFIYDDSLWPGKDSWPKLLIWDKKNGEWKRHKFTADQKPGIVHARDGRTIVMLPRPGGGSPVDLGTNDSYLYIFNVRVNDIGHLKPKVVVSGTYRYWGECKKTWCYTDWQTGERKCQDIYFNCLMRVTSYYTPVSASSLIISEEGPCINYWPDYYNFGNVTKCDIKSTTFKIKNGCKGTLSYTITSPCSWVTISPNSGTSDGEEDTITLTIDTADLSIGEHTCDISISSNAGDGVFQIRVNVVNNENGDDSSNGNDDNNPSIGELPVVQILKPRASYVYLRDKELLKINRDVPVIIGPINITANASDPDGSIAKVEFYTDDELKHNATDAPYYYYWNEKTIGIRTLRVRVYDNDDNFAEDTIDVLVINLKGK